MRNTQSEIKPIKLEKDLEQRIVLGVEISPIILGQEKWKWQIKYLEKNLTVLLVDEDLVCGKDTENIEAKMVRTTNNR